LAAILGLSLAATAGCQGSGGLEPAAKAAPAGSAVRERAVETITLSPMAHRSLIRATGTALPRRESLLSASVPGRIDRIAVERGDRVSAGQELLRLDRSSFLLGVEQAEAALAAARVALDAAAREKKRFDRLLANKAVPRASYDKVVAGYDGAAAQVEQAEVALKQARKALRDSVLRAPYDGVVTQVLKEVGEYAPSMPPTMLVKVVDTGALEVQTFLPEREAGAVREGQQARVRIESAGVEREGGVIFTSDRIQPGTQTFEVRVRLDNADGAIKAGAFARIELTRSKSEDVLFVPLRAVRRDAGRPFVFVARDGRAERVPVVLGETDGDRVVVREGLAAGQHLIVTAVTELTEGEAVRAQSAASAAAESASDQQG
jgi:membrane fusion protein (multidrug efflux system)